MTVFPCTLAWCQCGGLASFPLNLCWHITKRANRTENKIICDIIFMTTYAVMWMGESSQKSCEMASATSFLQLRRYDLNRKSDLLKVPSEQLLFFFPIILCFCIKTNLPWLRWEWGLADTFSLLWLTRFMLFIRIPRECGSLKQHAMKIQKPQII